MARRRFDFDAFDATIEKALTENEKVMTPLSPKPAAEGGGRRRDACLPPLQTSGHCV